MATFSGLQINTAGTYTITASDTTRVITTATSSSFTVSAGGASKLGITAQPSSIAAGGTTGLTVQVQDQYGNLVSSGTGSTDTISLALNSGSFNGGTTSKAAVGGIATFSGLQINTVGTYTLTASDTTNTGFTSATSSSFTVSPSVVLPKEISTSGLTVVPSGTATDSGGNLYVVGKFSGGNLSVGGFTLTLSRAGNVDGFLIKYDATGSVLWAKSFGTNSGSNTVSTGQLAVDANGKVDIEGTFTRALSTGLSATNYLNFGLAATTGTVDGFVTQVNSDGSFGWAKDVGGSAVTVNLTGLASFSSGSTPDNSVAVLGTFTGTRITTPSSNQLTISHSGNTDGFVIDLSSDGATENWANNFGKTGGGSSNVVTTGQVGVDATGYVDIEGSFNNSLVVNGASGNLINLGIAKTTGATADGFVAQLNPGGGLKWGSAQDIGGNGATVSLTSLDVVPSGASPTNGIAILGTFKGGSLTAPVNSLTLSGTGNTDGFVAEYSSAGVNSWAENFGSRTATNITVGVGGIAVDGNGNIDLVGSMNGNLTSGTPPAHFLNLSLTKTAGGVVDVFATQVSSTGALGWSHNYGGAGTTATAFGLTLDSLNNLIFIGSASGGGLTFGGTTLPNTSSQYGFIEGVSSSGAAAG